MVIPQLTYHFALSGNWDLYAKAGVGPEMFLPKKDNPNESGCLVYGNAALGTRFRIWKPICAFVEAGFPFASAGFSVLF